MSYGDLHPLLVVEGDSNTAATAAASWIPTAITRASIVNTFDLSADYNQAVGGETASQMASASELSAVNALNPDVVVIWAGTNDLSSTNLNPSAIYSNLTTAWKSYIDNGADYVVAVQITPRNDPGWQQLPQRELDRQSLNKMIENFSSDATLAGYGDHIRIVKVPASFVVSSDTFDGIHLSAKGAEKIGTDIGSVLSSLGNHDNRAEDLSRMHGFDTAYYLSHNADVAAAAASQGGDAFNFAYQHYQNFGWREGRNPNALFDVNGYLKNYADVKAAGTDPLTHYDTYGWKEGRDPSAKFDTQTYLSNYADVAAAHVDPMLHYLQFGAAEGRTAFGDGYFS